MLFPHRATQRMNDPMSFQTLYCWYCKSTTEYYQHRCIVPDCPRCGAGANGSPPDAAYVRSQQKKTQEEKP